MSTTPNFSLSLLSTLAIITILPACGKDGRVVTDLGLSKKTQKATEAVHISPHAIPLKQFNDQCAANNGRYTPAQDMCLAPVIVDYSPTGAIQQDIDAKFTPGKFVESTGTPGAGTVDIVLNGKNVMGIPERRVLMGEPGHLAFFTNVRVADTINPTSVTIWTCYDRNMQQVICPDPEKALRPRTAI